MKTAAPVFKHDCERCTFLGRALHPDMGMMDVYKCHDDDMLIARWEDAGPGYFSYTVGTCRAIANSTGGGGTSFLLRRMVMLLDYHEASQEGEIEAPTERFA